MSKIVVFFVEGDTEIEFYKALINHIRTLHGEAFPCKFEYKNLKGVGNFKNDSLRQLDAIKRKYPCAEIHIFLCYDTDAFKFSKNPPVDMNKVRRKLLTNGAKKVYLIRAEDSIEDWFLTDFDNIIRFLKLPQNTKKENGNGQDILKKLFKKANRLYVKGSSTSNFVESLDISKIQKGICSVIKPLCKCIGIDCAKICSK